MFLQSDRSLGVWHDNSFLRERYLSSPHLDTQRDSDRTQEGAVAISPRKWRSSQELRKSVCWESEDKKRIDQPSTDALQELDRARSKKGEARTSKWISRGSSSGIDLWEGGEEGLSPSHGPPLKKWSSLGEKYNQTCGKISPDSFYCSRSRSLQTEGGLQAKQSQNESYQSASSKIDGNRLSFSANELSAIKAVATDAEFFNKLKKDALARVEAVESLLRQSDDETGEGKGETRVNLYFKEVDPSQNEGYGCLITFESRSSSMDDLGSPRALEDVLVSLTSSDTDPKAYPSLSVGGTEVLLGETHKENIFSPERALFGEQEVCKSENYYRQDSETLTHSQAENGESGIKESWEQFSKDDDDERYPESDITINEDENFQYDSLKNEDQKIPLNIKAVLDSENSSDYSSINVSLKLASRSGRSSEIVESREVGADSDRSETSYEESAQSRQISRTKQRTGSYSLVNRKPLSSSVKGVVATDPLVLVHPGSLRSETVTESSGTLKESQKSSDTLKESAASSGSSKSSYKKEREREVSSGTKVRREKISSTNSALTKKHEKLISKKDTKSSSLSKTILIIRDKKHPKMNTTGTQTTHRGSPTSRISRFISNRSLPTSFTMTYKDKSIYSPLPDKVNGPWTAKYMNEKSHDNYPYFDNSNIKKLQKNLYNIAKADQILRKIHPFDYRPTMVHTDSLSKTSYSEPYKTPTKLALKSSKSTISPRVNQNFPLIYTSSPAQPTQYKSLLSSPSHFRRSFLRRKSSDSSQTSFGSPSRIKRVPKPYFSIYGKDVLDSSGERNSSLYENRRWANLSFDHYYQPRSSTIHGAGRYFKISLSLMCIQHTNAQY